MSSNEQNQDGRRVVHYDDGENITLHNPAMREDGPGGLGPELSRYKQEVRA